MGTSPLGGTFVMTSTVKTVSRVLATSWSTLRTWGSFSSLHFPSMIAEVAFSLTTSSRSFPVVLSDMKWVTGFSAAIWYPRLAFIRAMATVSTSRK